MSLELLFLVQAVSVLLGVVFAVRGIWCASGLLMKSGGSSITKTAWPIAISAVCFVIANTLPPSLGRPQPPAPWLPVVWPVMPFPGWILVICLTMIAIKIWSATQALDKQQAAKRWRQVIGWVAFGALNVWWWSQLHAPLELLRGAIPLSLTFVGAGVATLVVWALLVNWAKQRMRSSRAGRASLVYAALILGSAVFCLPLFWLLLTSFKERDDNTAANLVWVPKVTEQHAYFDANEPLYATPWRGTTVRVHRIQPPDPQAGQVEVERPFPLKGFRFRAEPESLRPEPRIGIVVDTTFQAEPVRGFVRRDLVGGQREVEILSPGRLKGRVFTTETNATKPVRKVGVRWENYSEALEWLPPETQHGLVYLRNTLWIVVMSTIGTLLSCSLVAYGFSRVRFPGRSALFGLMLATMMLPGVVTMLPKFLIWRGLGAVNTLVPIWLPTFTASAFFVFLLREFFKTLPKELEDAAKIDGCNPLRTYWQVMLPQIKPALTVIGIWTFMGAWNDFMSPLIYVSSSDKMPITYAIQLFSVDKGGEFGLMMAFATMATVPVLIVFLLGQRFFVEGVQLSGLGGK